MAKAEQEPLPAYQRILPGFQRCFTGRTFDGRRVHLDENVLGIPADLIVHQEDSETELILWKVGAYGILAKRGGGRWRKEPVLTKEVPRHIARQIILSKEIFSALEMERLAEGRPHWSSAISPAFDRLSDSQAGYATDVLKKTAALAQKKSTERLDPQEEWRIGGVSDHAASLLAKLGVIAFLLGKPDAEQFFGIRKRTQIVARDEITAGQAEKLLAHFSTDDGIRISNLPFQYSTAKALLLSYLKPEK